MNAWLRLAARALTTALALALAACSASRTPALSLPARATRARSATEPFVVRRGPCLERGGAPFRWIGSSAFYLQEEAAREAMGVAWAQGHVAASFDAAQRAGLTVLRIAGFHDGPRDPTAIQPTRGELSQAGLAGLDVVVAEAGRRGVRLIIVLSNYWDDYGGVAQYLRWHGLDPSHRAAAFTDARVLADVRAYAARIATRTNARTGIRYADDATIMAWEVMNEPRGIGLTDHGEAIASFVHDVATALHGVAPRQLVLAGDEGFDADVRGYDTVYWDANATAGLLGTSRHEAFRAMAMDPAIDAATIHWYPESWGVRAGEEQAAGVRWIREHAAIAREAGKPLVLEEFGLRDRVIDGRGGMPLDARRTAYGAWFEAARAESNVAGVMPWGLAFSLESGARDGFGWGAGDLAADDYAEMVRGWGQLFSVQRPCE